MDSKTPGKISGTTAKERKYRVTVCCACSVSHARNRSKNEAKRQPSRGKFKEFLNGRIGILAGYAAW